MKVLMVCLGNICRSPLAAAILNKKAKDLHLNIICDSAGTGSWHIGDQADRRSIEVAGQNGIDLTYHRARQVSRSDFDLFDVIYAMDSGNYEDLIYLAKSEKEKQKVKLILDEVFPGMNKPVPDPYYGGQDAFKAIFDLLDQACNQIVKKLK